MTVAIRPAHPADHAALCVLFDELDALHRRIRPDLFRAFGGVARPLAEIERWLAGPGSTVLVAEESDGLVGLAVLLARPPSPFAGAVPRKVIVIDNLVTRADRRGLGIGGKLVDAAMAWARAVDATHVELGVHAVNRDALRFYEHAGFAVSVNWMTRPVQATG